MVAGSERTQSYYSIFCNTTKLVARIPDKLLYVAEDRYEKKVCYKVYHPYFIFVLIYV